MKYVAKEALSLPGKGFAYNLVRWKHGELLKMPWNGFYVPALDTPMDLNGDGKNDVCFYKTLPATTEKSITYINVNQTLNGTSNPQRLSNDIYGELTWLNNVSRNFSSEKKYLYPIPQNDINVNPALEQKPILVIN